jgi:hypothetical protein
LPLHCIVLSCFFFICLSLCWMHCHISIHPVSGMCLDPSLLYSGGCVIGSDRIWSLPAMGKKLSFAQRPEIPLKFFWPLSSCFERYT